MQLQLHLKTKSNLLENQNQTNSGIYIYQLPNTKGTEIKYDKKVGGEMTSHL